MSRDAWKGGGGGGGFGRLQWSWERERSANPTRHGWFHLVLKGAMEKEKKKKKKTLL